MNAGERTGSMTLILTLSAIERLANPGAAVAEARTWSEHVGVVGDETETIDEVRSFVDGIDAEPDLVAGEIGGGLADLRQRLRTDRHVLLGTTDEQRAIATALGWEFKPIAAAAAAAGWDLRESADD